MSGVQLAVLSAGRADRWGPDLMETHQPTFVLTLRALPSDVPVVVRLRGVLKRLLRGYGFRCVTIEQEEGTTGCERSRRATRDDFSEGLRARAESVGMGNECSDSTR